MVAQAILIFTIATPEYEIDHLCLRQRFSNRLLHLMAKNSKEMKHPLFFYFNIFIMFFCYTKLNAQVGVDVRFNTYSNLELNGYTEHNTLILSANQDNIALIDKAMLLSLDNLVIRDVCIDDVLLARIKK